jgi:hypothetical protein
VRTCYSLWVATSVATQNQIIDAGVQGAEKVDLERVLVAQALLPVRVLLHIRSIPSQECLCYPTFSAACLLADAPDFEFSHRL